MVLLLKKAVGKTVIQILSMVSLINLSEVERETVWGTERWLLYVTFCVYLAKEISFFLRTWISYVCGNDEEVNFLISSNLWHIEILIAG